MDAEEQFKQAREAWIAALRGHVLAPPDAGFSARLATLADAARQRAAACEAAAKDRYDWPPSRGGVEPPYELRPGTGRRGPEELWDEFDDAVAEVDRVSEGRSMRAVGRAYNDLAEIAERLAKAIEAEDRTLGILPDPRQKRRNVA